MPLPVFLAWKLLMTGYIFVWLILHIVARKEFEVRWLIYMTNLAYLLLTIGTTAITLLTIWYTLIHYEFPDKLKSYMPRLKGTTQEIYSQDNLPWFAKICWALYLISTSLVPLIVAGYWILIYKPCPSLTGNNSANLTVNNPTMIVNTSNETSATPSTGGLGNIGGCSEPDVYTIHVHGINLVIFALDIIFSRVPFQFMHFFYPIFFMVPYVLFTVIYWGAGGLNPVDNLRYIYDTINYGDNKTAPLYAICLMFSPIPMYFLLFLAVWLRDVISTYISCCFRDMTPADEIKVPDDITVENGTEQEPESTKL